MAAEVSGFEEQGDDKFPKSDAISCSPPTRFDYGIAECSGCSSALRLFEGRERKQGRLQVRGFSSRESGNAVENHLNVDHDQDDDTPL